MSRCFARIETSSGVDPVTLHIFEPRFPDPAKTPKLVVCHEVQSEP